MAMVVGKVIKMPAMRKGLCRYADETVFLGQSTLETMAKTVHGIPVVVEHHNDINAANVEQLTVGRVADMHYDADRDEWDVHFVVDNEEAVSLLKNGWGVSTAYRIAQSGPGGTYNNVPYDREVTGAKYDHLAIVKNPRYEMAVDPVFYNSKDGLKTPDQGGNIDTSIPKKGETMFGKIFRTKREEVKLNEGEEMYVMVGETEMKLDDVVAAVHDAEMKKNSKKVVMNADDMITYNGEEMTVKSLVDKFNACNADEEKKENAEGEDKEEKKENAEGEDKDKEEKKENAEGEDKEEKKENAEGEDKDKEEKKENSVESDEQKHFDELKQIKENGTSGEVKAYLSIADQLELGRKLFGSK